MVSVGVVDMFELVHVQIAEHEAFAALRGVFDQVLRLVLEGVTGAGSGQRVRARPVFEQLPLAALQSVEKGEGCQHHDDKARQDEYGAHGAVVAARVLFIVDENRSLGKTAAVQPEAIKDSGVEHEGVGAFGDDLEITCTAARKDVPGHGAGGQALMVAAGDHASDGSRAEIEVPEGENRHRTGLDDHGAALGVGEGVAVAVAVHAHEQDDAVGRQVRKTLEQTRHGHVLQHLHFEAFRETFAYLREAPEVAKARGRGVVDDVEALCPRHKTCACPHRGCDVIGFKDAGNVFGGHGFRIVEKIYATKDDGRIVEQALAILPREVEGVVVGCQDHGKIGETVFLLKQLIVEKVELRFRMPLGIHPFHVHLRAPGCTSEAFGHAAHDVVGPFEARIVGVQDEDVAP